MAKTIFTFFSQSSQGFTWQEKLECKEIIFLFLYPGLCLAKAHAGFNGGKS